VDRSTSFDNTGHRRTRWRPLRVAALALLPVAALTIAYGNEVHRPPVTTPVAEPPAEERTLSRGEWVAIAGNCETCHTSPGGRPFAGGLSFDTPFGKIYSTNITPDEKTGIGRWTREDFIQSLRHGVRPDGEHLYPVFPYTAFTKITDADAAALFDYLKNVPAVSYTPPENEMSFPFNQRWLLGAWKMLFLDAGEFQPDPTKSKEWNQGAYLVEGLAHCSACHSPRNFMGAEKKDAAMTGGIYTDKVPGGALRKWSTPNLTSASNGLGAWEIEDLVAYLKTGQNSFLTTYGPMNEVILHSTRHLPEADVRAMAVYLKSLPANEGDVEPPPSAEDLKTGRILYNVYCGTCHLPTGLGDDDVGARLAGGSLVVQANDPAGLINVILYGPELPSPRLPSKRSKDMPAFGDELSDEDVALIASYIRSSWNNKGGRVTPEQVAAQR
jgi:mono/diheme cytochrome c family protein